MPRKSPLESPLSEVSDDLWAVARKRERVIRDLLEKGSDYGARTETVTAAASELGMTVQHLYRLCKCYEQDPRTRALLPKRPGPPTGILRLDPRVEAILNEEIQTRYLSLLKPKKAALLRGIKARCDEVGLQSPSRRTLDTRLAKISKREQTKKRQGAKRAREVFDPIRGELAAERPLEIVQIDHTPADVMVVDPETNDVIGRPFITLAVDVRTRMYCGLYLTFDPPSVASVASCLAHAVMDKEDWLVARGLPPRWPVMGQPELIHVDNGPEFHSKAFERACGDYGIDLDYRPPGTPNFGGHVERRIGHLAQELHLLPGTTFSNVKERGIYDSAGAACLTIAEIEILIASIILEHHATFHEGICASPEAKWATEAKDRIVRMPQDMRTFYRDFLPFEERRVLRDGIHLFGIRYWNDALMPFLHNEQRVIVHYDPANLSKVFIRGLSGEYLDVPYRNICRPAISKWELRAVNRALRRAGKAGVDEGMIFDMVLTRRKIVEEAKGRSRRARMERARGARPTSGPTLPEHPQTPVIDGDYSVVDEAEDTPIDLPFVETEDWDE